MRASPILPIALLATLAVAAPGNAADRMQQGNAAMTKIHVIAGGTVLSATLEDTPAARDFAAMLPLELTLRDFHGTEKIADLPRKLTTTGAPDSYAAAAGDITYYAPWGNLAIFYRPFQTAAGLVPLGRFDAPLDGRLADGPVRIERAD